MVPLPPREETLSCVCIDSCDHCDQSPAILSFFHWAIVLMQIHSKSACSIDTRQVVRPYKPEIVSVAVLYSRGSISVPSKIANSCYTP